jgi:hypothetical protein
MLTQSGRALLLLLGALIIAVGANAEKKSIDPFGARAAPTSAFAPPTAAPFRAPGPPGRVFALVFEQQSLQRTLAMSVKSLKTDPPGGAITLALLSFVYGVLHAVGHRYPFTLDPGASDRNQASDHIAACERHSCHMATPVIMGTFTTCSANLNVAYGQRISVV